MSFIHEDQDFDALLRIVASKRKLPPGLVEKDYWVTHTLWALHQTGLAIWFKGGTSLSKGFGLIERFSEDLDLKIEPGSNAALPAVSNWKSEGSQATQARRARFEKLPLLLEVPGAQVSLDRSLEDRAWRSVNIRVTYPGRHLSDLRGVLAPFVLLEVGSARVTPFIAREMTSFVHEELSVQGQLGGFDDNRPQGVRCIHPLVTLLEKLDALHRRVPNENAAPAAFVRHFEDAARVIAAEKSLPALDEYASVRELAQEMLAQKQLVALPSSEDPAFLLLDGERTKRIHAAHAAISPMFWGRRIGLDEACTTIRQWGRHNFE